MKRKASFSDCEDPNPSDVDKSYDYYVLIYHNPITIPIIIKGIFSSKQKMMDMYSSWLKNQYCEITKDNLVNLFFVTVTTHEIISDTVLVTLKKYEILDDENGWEIEVFINYDNMDAMIKIDEEPEEYNRRKMWHITQEVYVIDELIFNSLLPSISSQEIQTSEVDVSHISIDENDSVYGEQKIVIPEKEEMELLDDEISADYWILFHAETEKPLKIFHKEEEALEEFEINEFCRKEKVSYKFMEIKPWVALLTCRQKDQKGFKIMKMINGDDIIFKSLTHENPIQDYFLIGDEELKDVKDCENQKDKIEKFHSLYNPQFNIIKI